MHQSDSFAKANTSGIFMNSSHSNRSKHCRLDTGATNHMSYRSDCLSDLKNVTSRIQLSDGSYFIVRGVGNFKVFENRALQNVIYLPNFKYNMLSKLS